MCEGGKLMRLDHLHLLPPFDAASFTANTNPTNNTITLISLCIWNNNSNNNKTLFLKYYNFLIKNKFLKDYFFFFESQKPKFEKKLKTKNNKINFFVLFFIVRKRLVD